MPSDRPIEQRCRPAASRRGRKDEPLTVGDRLVRGACGGGLGFILWTAGHLVLVRLTMRATVRHPVLDETLDPWNRLPAFGWYWVPSLILATIGAVAGPPRPATGSPGGI